SLRATGTSRSLRATGTGRSLRATGTGRSLRATSTGRRLRAPWAGRRAEADTEGGAEAGARAEEAEQHRAGHCDRRGDPGDDGGRGRLQDRAVEEVVARSRASPARSLARRSARSFRSPRACRARRAIEKPAPPETPLLELALRCSRRTCGVGTLPTRAQVVR